MNYEELQQIILLLDNGFYDEQVVIFANKHKPKHVDYYFICKRDMMELSNNRCQRSNISYNALN